MIPNNPANVSVIASCISNISVRNRSKLEEESPLVSLTLACSVLMPIINSPKFTNGKILFYYKPFPFPLAQARLRLSPCAAKSRLACSTSRLF